MKPVARSVNLPTPIKRCTRCGKRISLFFLEKWKVVCEDCKRKANRER